MSKTYLIWFNGTCEKIQHTEHLFFSIPKENKTIVPGWGTGGAMSGTHNLSDKKARASGISKTDIDIFEPYLTQKSYRTESYTLRGDHNDGLELLQKIKSIDKLIVGGFSRGSAFFVPYFLNLVKQKGETPNFKKLMIVLMDPVHGSSSDKDVTKKTLIGENLGSVKEKKDLIQWYKDHDVDVYGLVMSPGLDRRTKNFQLDNTFIQAMSNMLTGKHFIMRMGISHAVLSTWSQEEGYRRKVIESLKLTRTSEGSNWQMGKSKPEELGIEQMVQDHLDFVITRPIIDLIYHQATAPELLLKLIDSYQDYTDKILHNYSAVDYDFDLTGSLIYWGKNNEKDMAKCKRDINHYDSNTLNKVLSQWLN